MRTPEEVSAMLALKAGGLGSKRIATELGCSRNTVKRWLATGGWRAPSPMVRAKALDGLEDWVAERFRQHAGNADVVRQELAAKKGITVSLRTVERAVAPLRQELRAEARATVRFEGRPGQQLQIDFGERRVEIGDTKVKVFFFVATGTELRVSHAGREVACHRLRPGHRARIVDRAHFEGITGSPLARTEGQAEPETATVSPELLRPLSEYEAVAGGAW